MKLDTHLELDYFSEEFEVCGIDEAGRGPMAGPLSLSLVHFNKNDFFKFVQSDTFSLLDDSKKLSVANREQLYHNIINQCTCFVHQLVSNQFIDTYGLSYSLFYAIIKLIKKSKLSKPFLLVDGNYKFEKWMDRTNTNFLYKSVVKGDSRVASIASASIIAKVMRDRYMDKISYKYPEYHFEENKGYGTKFHKLAMDQFGLCKIHRKSFHFKK